MNMDNPTQRDWASHPPLRYPPYKSTILRAPTRPLVPLKHRLGEMSGPVYGHEKLGSLDHDLTRNGCRGGEPLGERIIVTGRVMDEQGRPLLGTLIEIWQANACGRYVHKADQHDAPLDANFLGAGRAITDASGCYRFLTIKPGAYPWRNHHNAWRPAHIHLSLFGQGFGSRLVTHLYFPGDPLQQAKSRIDPSKRESVSHELNHAGRTRELPEVDLRTRLALMGSAGG